MIFRVKQLYTFTPVNNVLTTVTETFHYLFVTTYEVELFTLYFPVNVWEQRVNIVSRQIIVTVCCL